jgi:lipoprotein-releasing system permease protein
MFKSIPFLIGLRYILARKNNRFISFTSLISMAGLILGVLAIIVVLSVFNGSQGIMRDRTLITVSHGEIQADASFNQWEEAMAVVRAVSEVSGVAPYIPLEAMLSQRDYHQVTQIKAILPELETRVSSIADNMVQGRLEDLRPRRNGIILGRTLAGDLRLNPGDAVNLVVPGLSGNSRLTLNMHRFTVVGIFDPQFTIGSTLALIHLDDGSALTTTDDVSAAPRLRIRVADLDKADSVVSDVVDELNRVFPEAGFRGQDWSTMEASLFNALKMEKIMTWFMLMMIVAIGAFNIISTLVMVVSEKRADIAILRTMGASENTIMGIFIVQGTMVGIIGTLAGALTGVLLAANFSKISAVFEAALSPGDLYLITALPSRLQSADVWITCAFALLISFMATLYPAWKASQILPAEVLRYE